MEWAKRNKALIGILFGGAGLYVNYSCPGLSHVICDNLSKGLISVGSFLAGAGLLPSDYREKFVQGLIKKEEEK